MRMRKRDEEYVDETLKWMMGEKSMMCWFVCFYIFLIFKDVKGVTRVTYYIVI